MGRDEKLIFAGNGPHAHELEKELLNYSRKCSGIGVFWKTYDYLGQTYK